MDKEMKKRIEIILGLILAISVTACGPTTTETSDSVEATKTESESKEVKGDVEAGTVLVSEGGKEVTSKNGKTLEDINIAIIQQDATAPASIMLYDALEEYAATYYPEVKYTLVNGEGDAAFQVELIDQFISQGVDVIAINAADAGVVVGAVEDAISAGIPVISVSAALAEEVGQYTVNSDNIAAGEMHMRYVCENILHGEGSIAIIRGDDGHIASIERTKGYENALAEYPNVKVVFNDTGKWFRDVSMNLTETWLQTGEKIDVILGEDDNMAMGAYDAVEAAGMQGEILVTGINFTEAGAEYTRDGKLCFNVLQNCPAQGRETFEMAVQLALGNEVSNVDIPFEVIAPDQVQAYLEEYWPNLLE